MMKREPLPATPSNLTSLRHMKEQSDLLLQLYRLHNTTEDGPPRPTQTNAMAPISWANYEIKRMERELVRRAQDAVIAAESVPQ
jgi:hypothetical protein